VTSISAKRRSIGEEYKEFKEYEEYEEYQEFRSSGVQEFRGSG
jgi:hypothetical protein